MFMRELLLLLCFFTLTSVIAQNAHLSDEANVNLKETGNWNGMYLRLKFSEKLFYYGEHHYRRRNSENNLYDFVGNMRQLYNRAGINYFYNEHFNVVIGPTLVLNYSPQPDNDAFDKITFEPRIWHQWLFVMPYLGRTKLYHQFRFEHRWRRSNLAGSDFNYTNRYRYKFYAYIPLNKKKLDYNTLFISPSVEMFFETGKSILNPFEDFRVYNGIGYILNDNITFFGGHMWTFGPEKNTLNYRTSHIIRLNVLFTFDLRSTKQLVPQIHMMY
jgi:hypothetical protein